MDKDFKNMSKKIKDLILESENIGICGHISPDGDCLGSALSLFGAVKKLNENTVLLKNDEIPDYLHILKGLDKMTEISDDMSFDLFIIVDCSSLDRTGACEKLFNQANNTICIDHHASNTFFADVNYVNDEIASTCELVYELIHNMNIPYDQDMANNSFIGILTDTNRFLYSSTSARTHEIAADLLSYDFDRNYIMQELYQSNSLSSVKLTAEVIRKMKLLHDNKLSLCSFTKEELDEFGATIDDLEDKINILRDIDTVELACTIREEDDSYKVSMRSKKHVDVSEICTSFGGGGHLRAAGFSYDGNLNDLKDMLLKRFNEIDWSSI